MVGRGKNRTKEGSWILHLAPYFGNAREANDLDPAIATKYWHSM